MNRFIQKKVKSTTRWVKEYTVTYISPRAVNLAHSLIKLIQKYVNAYPAFVYTTTKNVFELFSCAGFSQQCMQLILIN